MKARRRPRAFAPLVAIAFVLVDRGASGAANRAAPAKPAAGALPMTPSVPRVRLVFAKTQLVVVEEVSLPRGEWKDEPLDLYVAFGAPGPPRAVDAHLLAVGDGALEPASDAAGEPLVAERAPRRPPSAHALLGRDTMAGVVVHVPADAMTRALAPGGMAALRIRTALDLPEEDPAGGRSALVRLGATGGTPLTLGRVVVGSAPGAAAIARAEARLCGPDADAQLLAVHLEGRPRQARSSVVAPVLAARRASDDLCVRAWTAP